VTTESNSTEGSGEADSTETRILNAAEEMFAEFGYYGVSMRNILRNAGANSSAAHYYFRNKENLFRVVIKRRAQQLNARRHEMLVACIDNTKNGRPDIAELVTALLAPALEMARTPSGKLFNILSGLATIDRSVEVQNIIREVYDETAKKFVEGVQSAKPDWSREQVFWFSVCVYGTMTLVRTDNPWIQSLFDNEFAMNDPESTLRHLVPLLSAAATHE
jgi:AcrR family transcriptional regulator